jgi:UDP-N-acetylmuramoyl-tripeptide--D-alanyl-D-alanine ligase
VKRLATVDLSPRLDIETLRRVLLRRLGGTVSGPETLPAASGAAFHTALVRPGDAFFALPGEHAHGFDFVDEAFGRGAAFVVSDRDHPRGVRVDDPAAALLALGHEARAAWRSPVIGVSGSVGKTTMKALLAAALAARSSAGNRNTPLALAATLVDGWLALDVERPLVLELGIDHAGEMDQLTDLVRPTHAILTAIEAAHLDGLGDLAGVAREKGRLLEAASLARYAAAGAWRRLTPALRARTVRYGLGEPDAPTGRYRAQGDGGVLDALVAPGEELSVRLPGLGAALAEHALGALVVARDLGVPLDAAAARLGAAPLEGRRLQRHTLGDLSLLDDSYNASPASMRLALEVLASLPQPHAAVLGDMRELGAEAEAQHALLAPLCRGLTPLWAVGAHAMLLVRDHPNARHYADVGAALRDLAELPRRGTLLVKGSRSIGLERVVDALLERGARAAPPAEEPR